MKMKEDCHVHYRELAMTRALFRYWIPAGRLPCREPQRMQGMQGWNDTPPFVIVRSETTKQSIFCLRSLHHAKAWFAMTHPFNHYTRNDTGRIFTLS
jgi:hypothetical protein